MSRLNAITTKYGDSGMTNLVYKDVHKSSDIIECIGSIDEANSTIGVALDRLSDFVQEYQDMFDTIQNNLFDLSADIILNTNKINKTHIEYLESEIHRINKALPALESFIIPTGDTSIMHQARSVVRRAERSFWKAVNNDTETEHVLDPGVYLNRLSDLLFVVCRDINHKYFTSKEETWVRI